MTKNKWYVFIVSKKEDMGMTYKIMVPYMSKAMAVFTLKKELMRRINDSELCINDNDLLPINHFNIFYGGMTIFKIENGAQ